MGSKDLVNNRYRKLKYGYIVVFVCEEVSGKYKNKNKAFDAAIIDEKDMISINMNLKILCKDMHNTQN